jgi:hypothetical protein
LVLFSCTKEGEFTVPIEQNNSIVNTILLKSGAFSPTSGIAVNGNVEIRKRNNEHFVSLINFNISSGPDLKVYLSKNNTPSEFVNLGALENNKNVYNIPESVMLDEYSYVLIHCQQYNHLFAIAKLN